MVINHNNSALHARRSLGKNTATVAKDLEQLASGLRINRAADDAAGLAISQKMRNQLHSLDMAEMNAKNGMDLINTAEGGLAEMHSILGRIRELAVQSSNGTYMDADRAQMDKEVQQLKGEIDRIAQSTHYNGIPLLNGNLAVKAGVPGTPGTPAPVPTPTPVPTPSPSWESGNAPALLSGITLAAVGDAPTALENTLTEGTGYEIDGDAIYVKENGVLDLTGIDDMDGIVSIDFDTSVTNVLIKGGGTTYNELYITANSSGMDLFIQDLKITNTYNTPAIGFISGTNNTLTLLGTNTLTNASATSATIDVHGSTGLAIFGEAGTLNVESAGQGAAIGGNGIDGQRDGGTITINSGTIHAIANNAGAAIGGGYGGGGGTITISGGDITATSNNAAAAIGAGFYSSGGDIIIGGSAKVKAENTLSGAAPAIGEGAALTVSGGLLEVTSGKIGTTASPATTTITGGNILVSVGAFTTQPTSDGTTALNKIEISGVTLPSGETMEIDIDGTTYTGVVSGDGKLTIYLPASATGKEATITGGGKTFEGTISSSGGLALAEVAPGGDTGTLATKSVPAYQALFGMWFGAAMDKIEKTTGWTFPADMTINVKFDNLADDVVATCGMPPTLSGQKTQEITITFNTDFIDPDKPITEMDGKIAGNYFPSDTVLAHELVHGLMFANIPAGVVATIPAWFTEGLAEAAVGKNRFHDFASGASFNTTEMDEAHSEVQTMTNLPYSDPGAKGGYTAGYLFMNWLDHYDKDNSTVPISGGGKVKELVEELKTALSFDAALTTIFGKDSANLMAAFQAEENTAHGNGSTAYINWLEKDLSIQPYDGKESDALSNIDSTLSGAVEEAAFHLATLVDDVTRIQHNGKYVTFKWDLASAGVAAKQTKIIPPAGVSFAPNAWVKLKANGTEQEVQTNASGELILDAFGTGDIELELTHNGVTYSATFTIGDEALDFNQRDEVPGTPASGGLILQIGSGGGTDQRIGISIGDMSTGSIGISFIHVDPREAANAAIALVDHAAMLVSSQRATLGAAYNRLQHALSSLGISIENLSSAESIIRDTDMAEAMMTFTKDNVLQQAAQAMLAQANSLPEGALQLLR